MAKNPEATHEVEKTRGVAPNEEDLKKQTALVTDAGNRPKTLSELMGGFVQSLMEDPREITRCYRELSLWYEAQPLDSRKEVIAETRKKLERAKLAAEAMYGQFQMLAQKDM